MSGRAAFHTLQCRYILNSVRFRTDSNSVRKINLKIFNKIFRTELDSVRKQKNLFKHRKKFRTESNSVRKKTSNILNEKILRRILFGSKKIGVFIEKLLICSSAHLFTYSSDHSNIDMRSQLFDESSMNVKVKMSSVLCSLSLFEGKDKR